MEYIRGTVFSPPPCIRFLANGVFLVEWNNFRVAGAGIVRTSWCGPRLCCCEKTFLLVGFCDMRCEEYCDDYEDDAGDDDDDAGFF